MTGVVQLDYWDLVTRSLRLAWKYKFLWFFGFFASSGGGGNFGTWQEDAAPWLREYFVRHPYAFVLLIMAAVIVVIALFVLNIICTGGLIRSVSSAGRGGAITFGQTWRAGLSTFWRLLGLTVLTILAFLVVTAVAIVPVVISALGGAPGIVIAVLIAAILFLPYLAFLFLLTFTVIYAEREIVLQRADILTAIREGWELTRQNLGRSFMVWLVMLLSSLLFMMGLLIVLLILAIPFFLIGMGNLVLGLALGIPVGVVVLILTSAWYNTYAYSVWTMAYERLKGASVGGETEPPEEMEGMPIAA